MDTSTAVAAIDTLGRRIGPRRHRTVEEKLQIVAETRVAGSSVADVARRYGVNANQVFVWRRQQEQGVLRPDLRSGVVKLLPVQVTGEPSVRRTDSPAAVAAVAAASEGRIEITLAKDIRIAIIGAVSVERLEHVLTMLRRSP